MATEKDWQTVTENLRSQVGASYADVWSRSEVATLFKYALSDGVSSLSRLGCPASERDSVVSEVFLRCLPRIIDTDKPRAYFHAALVKDRISHYRRERHRSDLSSSSGPISTGPTPEEDADAKTRLDLVWEMLLALPEREREIFVRATCTAEERERIAADYGTSRANVDQIVSRVRRRLAEGSK